MKSGSVSHQSPAVAPKNKCIVVVDDEFLIRCMLSDGLREVGYQVVEACDAGEALKILETLKPDFIISDVRMPGPIDGMALLALVREADPTLPVMIISGHLHPQQALKEGATRFIAKPYRIDEVVDAVQDVLENNR